jgi:hypothetical protein
MTFEGQEISELVRITILAGRAFRGVIHRAERDYSVAPSLADHVIKAGRARLADNQRTA